MKKKRSEYSDATKRDWDAWFDEDGVSDDFMSTNLLGLGDLDVEEIDRQKRERLKLRNPNNEPEVKLSKWTHAVLVRDGKRVGHVVYGCVIECLIDDYEVSEIACSGPIIFVPDHPGRRIYVTKNLRFECVKEGNEIEIEESELPFHLPGSPLP